MADKTEILIGYKRPFREDPTFREAMKRANDALKFKPLMGRGIFVKEKAGELNEVVKKRREK